MMSRVRKRWRWMVSFLGWASMAAVAGGAPPAGLVRRATDAGIIVGYKDTPRLPWTGGKFHVHDPDRPAPRCVTPAADAGLGTRPPSDAVVLFDGRGVESWQASDWKIVEQVLEAGGGNLVSKASFGDLQLHLEWMAPKEPGPNFMNRGNSGVLLMGRYEIQIFDSWREHDLQIYPDGQAASVYGQTPPRVNACRPPGAWQAYDLIFHAPRFQQGKLVQKARVTLIHNGVVVLSHCEIMGPMAHRRILPYEPHPPRGPLVLQGHHCPVRFRNVWVRPL